SSDGSGVFLKRSMTSWYLPENNKADASSASAVNGGAGWSTAGGTAFSKASIALWMRRWTTCLRSSVLPSPIVNGVSSSVVSFRCVNGFAMIGGGKQERRRASSTKNESASKPRRKYA